MLKSGELRKKCLIAISLRATAENADEYFDDDLMIRVFHHNAATNTVEFHQLMMPSPPLEVIETLYERIGIRTDDSTITDTPDKSTKYLASPLKASVENLPHVAADIAAMIDQLLLEHTATSHQFGRPINRVDLKAYEQIFYISKQKERRRASAVEYLKKEHCRLVYVDNANIKDELRRVYEHARALVADIEGEEYVKDRYGEVAVAAWQERQLALNDGNWNGADVANTRMQASMGDIVICNQRLDSPKNVSNKTPDLLDGIMCKRLPKPGEKAACPGCGQIVRVAGKVGNIRCSRPQCKLADSKARRHHQQNQAQIKQRAELRKKHQTKKSASKPTRELTSVRK